jgi:hypothetical protein
MAVDVLTEVADRPVRVVAEYVAGGSYFIDWARSEEPAERV